MRRLSFDVPLTWICSISSLSPLISAGIFVVGDPEGVLVVGVAMEIVLELDFEDDLL